MRLAVRRALDYGLLMADISQILGDPQWLPHTFDPARGSVSFIQIPRSRLSQNAFLADATSEPGHAPVEISLGDISAFSPPQAPQHFIFHTAFCRSTLLVRALELPGVSAGLSEPGILARLVGKGDAGMRAKGHERVRWTRSRDSSTTPK